MDEEHIVHEGSWYKIVYVPHDVALLPAHLTVLITYFFLKMGGW